MQMKSKLILEIPYLALFFSIIGPYCTLDLSYLDSKHCWVVVSFNPKPKIAISKV